MEAITAWQDRKLAIAASYVVAGIMITVQAKSVLNNRYE
jgi:hypothetical protein